MDSNKTNFREEVTRLSFDEFKSVVLNDYRIVNESRQASLSGRKEVLTGKAKFGIFGDGKELAQVAMAKVFKNGDFRSGYYRDQTFMFASGLLTVQEFFAQLYANPDVNADPSSGGRCMNGHFATRLLNEDGSWKNLTDSKNSSADISPTAGQMPRLLGLALASKLYRQNPELAASMKGFTLSGNEVAFGTIGDASTSEGIFFETINAAGVTQVPMAVSVWDDGYGISVPAKYQTTKQNISEILSGFAKTEDQDGYIILSAKAWDYPGLIEMYEKGIAICRERHIPVIFHIKEVTQPQGHSTSGSHERYKSPERLLWEEETDCIRKFREWILQNAIASEGELDQIETESRDSVRESIKKAWNHHIGTIRKELITATELLQSMAETSSNRAFIEICANKLREINTPERRDIGSLIRKALRYSRNENTSARTNLISWFTKFESQNNERFNSGLFSSSRWSIPNITPVAPIYNNDSPQVDGREVLQANWDLQLSRIPELVIFGEDVGNIGGVNQTYAGLQAKYGEHRIFDTGIREATIVGQGIGLALRGFRPVAEIQYLDYLAYAIQILSDDLASLQYRTKGGQKAPLIITTRGHRLEGIWHSGSPMQFILGALRGIHVLVPRNMTQAAGFYNTLLAGDEPALLIEPLNGYRIKEAMPANTGEFRLRIGQVEVINKGEDITIVTYGSCVRIAQEAIQSLQEIGISVELIDVQSLLPFDLDHDIAKSLSKTGRILFLDEDVPGGASAFMLQQVIEHQDGFRYLDQEPVTLTAKEHRPAYGSDGDYYSKPSAEDVFDAVYRMMRTSATPRPTLLFIHNKMNKGNFQKITESESRHQSLETLTVDEILNGINSEDLTVAIAVKEAIPSIEKVVLAILSKMKNGGRLFYLGAGTSGRLGILDASECPPTYGVPHGMVIGLIAGGDTAIRKAVEFAEDDTEQGWKDLCAHQIGPNDSVIGIAASGSTPYVLGALERCNREGILTSCITCNPGSPLAQIAQLPIVVVTGPEYVTGSTRMKAGSAQKLVLNMISTTVMIGLGRVKGNRMVDMQLSNMKLIDRGTRMIMESTGLDAIEAEKLLNEHGSVRKAIEHFQN